MSETKKLIVVTGGSGKAGRATVRDLLDHGYDVLNVDLAPPPEPQGRFLRADLTQLGQAYEVLRGAFGVVHLAAIPSSGIRTEEVTFRENLASTYNVFSAAIGLGLQRIVWASSETTLGLPFDNPLPTYAPIDEEHPLIPNSSYALSKVLMEEMARQMARWSGIPIVGLRFSNIMTPERYATFPQFWDKPRARKWNLWGYVDARDVAQSCRLGLEAPITGAESFIIAAADTVMPRPSRELLTEVFPTVPLRGEVGEWETLLAIGKARRLLGYNPAYSWRDHVAAP
jgi:nucleoside-diphosphate-sugar epimerase